MLKEDGQRLHRTVKKAKPTGGFFMMHESAKLADSGVKYDMTHVVQIVLVSRAQPHDQL